MVTTEDELIARLKTVAGASGAYDDYPPGFVVGVSPVLILQHISTVPDIPIDGEILGNDDRYQVSVRGTKRSNVQAVARRVIDALHGYTSAAISRVDFESWPGTIREDGSTIEYHAPVDFTVYR